MFETPQHSAPTRNPARPVSDSASSNVRNSMRGGAGHAPSSTPYRSRLEARSRSHHPTAHTVRPVLIAVDEPIEVPSFVLPRHQQRSAPHNSSKARSALSQQARGLDLSTVEIAKGRQSGQRSAALTVRAVRRSGAPQFARPHVVVRWVLALALCVAAVIGIAATGAAASSEPEPGVEHVVRPGESLWSIASDLDLDVDTRDLVDQLMALNGTDGLRTGEVVTIPAELVAQAAAAGK